MSAGSGGSGLSGLLSPGGGRADAPAGRHRLATEGTSGTPASAGGGSGGGGGSGRALSSAALSRLFSSPTSEADLFTALQVSGHGMGSRGGGQAEAAGVRASGWRMRAESNQRMRHVPRQEDGEC